MCNKRVAARTIVRTSVLRRRDAHADNEILRTMNLPVEFQQWALDPARTNDELFTVEILLEWGRVVWGWKHQQPKMPDWDKEQAHRKERRLNPAYRTQIKRDYLDATIEIWADIKKFYYTSWEDRPMRNIEALRFFPHLEEVQINDAEIPDLSPLASLRQLTTLHLHEPLSNGGHVMHDLNAIAGLPALSRVSVSLRRPWPNVSALAELPALQSLVFTGNLLALRDVPRLPALEKATFNADFNWKTPLRDLRDLPEMPRVVIMKVEGVANLRGLDRYPRILNANLIGPFQDLEPLGALNKCTYLRLEGEQFSDLTPAAGMQELRELLLVRERPLDLAPLSDAVGLREVNIERCSILRTELSALSATLLPWDGDFLAPERRQLAPLRFFVYQPSHEEMKTLPPYDPSKDPRKAFYGEDEAFARAEARWFALRLQAQLDEFLGKGWGNVNSTALDMPGHEHLVFKRFRDVMRFREIVEKLREIASECRFRWQYLISVEPHGDLSDEDEMEDDEEREDWLEQEFDPEREKEEWDEFRAQRRLERERLEREHRLKILQQQGAEIDPAEFSPGSEKPRPAQPAADAGGDADDEEEGDEEREGGLAEAIPPDDEEGLGRDLSFVVSLDEKLLFVSDHMREEAEYLFGETAVSWHSLPEPPTERPRPLL
jgi:hypothetical protein